MNADVTICVTAGDSASDLFKRVAKHVTERRLYSHGVRLVDSSEGHELVFRSNFDCVVVELKDEACINAGLITIPYTVHLDFDSICSVFSAGSNFFYHLRRSSRGAPMASRVALRAFELEERYDEKGNFTWIPKGGEGDDRNLNRGHVIRAKVDGTAYGFKIISSVNEPLYVWAFCFNMSDLSVRESFCLLQRRALISSYSRYDALPAIYTSLKQGRTLPGCQWGPHHWLWTWWFSPIVLCCRPRHYCGRVLHQSFPYV